ncbi:acylamino acid-releasing protein, partial [Planctomycetota bacterium]
SKTYGLVKRERNFRITVKMPHGHEQGWAPKEIGLFVDQYINSGVSLPAITSTKIDNGNVRAEVKSKTALASANLHYTTGTVPINKLEWETVPARIEGRQIVALAPPDETTIWFLTVSDVRGAIVSSQLVFSAERD